MNTVPLRARKSNDSWSDRSNGGLRPSLRQIQRKERGARRRFIFSVSLFVFTIAGLVVGGTGGFISEASAQTSNQSQYWNQINNRFEWLWSGNSRTTTTQRERSRTNTPVTQPSTERTQQTPAPTQQQAPTTTQPAPAQTQTQTATPAQARTPVQTTANEVEASTQSEASTPAVNTAADIETMAVAQASTEAKPVTYTSNQISTESRNRLLALAVSALTSGSLIFIMSLFGTTGTSPSVARYRKLGREVLAS